MLSIHRERTWQRRATCLCVGEQNDLASLDIHAEDRGHAIVGEIERESVGCEEKLDRMLQAIRCVGDDTLAQSSRRVEGDDL